MEHIKKASQNQSILNFQSKSEYSKLHTLE